ncbi:MAG TPA: transketolase C-terminal domain-containing protein, partial [Candidatus Poseidoniales archaeon]|nr:transketolase C-terminal domain-containing protein [Candidatus Poseidoniales archaeon]
HIGLYGLRGGRTGWGDCISQNVDTKGIHNDLDKGLGPHRIGTARTVRTGGDLTIITWSAMVHVALRAAEQLAAEHGIGVEVIDLRTLIPWDEEMCIDSVSRTGRLMVLQEAQWTGGFAHTIASRVLESTFWNLETQPIVLGSLDTPVPFSPPLERHTVPSKELIIEHVVRMMA